MTTSILQRARRSATRGRTVVCVATLCACTFLVSPASAQPAAPGSTQSAASLARFEEGKKRYDEGKFEEALLAFQASLEMQPSPNTRLYVGRCFRALGKTASAYTNLRLASREAQDRLAASNEKRYAATRDAAASEAAEIEPKVPRLTLAVPSDVPPGFVLRLDDVEVARAAWGTAIEIDPGAHKIHASGPRLRDFERAIDLGEGAQERVEVATERIPTARLTLVFSSRPSGMAVEVDGKPVDPAQAATSSEVDVGGHRVIVRAPGYRDFVWQQSLADGADTKVRIALEPAISASGGSSGTPMWLFFGVGGTSVVLGAIGTVFAVQASDKASEEEAKSKYVRTAEDRDEVGGLATRANVLFIASAVVAAGTVVLGFTTDWGGGDEDAEVALRAWATPGAAGLGVGGTW